jgi:peptidoglycan/xylan/chitin deacetylase (PgdA/CDA1 family)
MTPPRRPRRDAHGAASRPGRPSRGEVRRRRALLGLVVAAIALIVGLLVGGAGGSSRRAAGAATGARASRRARRGATGRPQQEARSASRPGAESAEVRALIALGWPIYCAGPHGDEVALTFDDGPGPYTRLMLAKLRKHGLHATFFVVGRNIPLVPGATRAELAQGAVGDHTFRHRLLTALPAAEARQEIADTKAALQRSSASRIFLFRPPYGGHDARIDSLAHELGLLEILWTVDSADSLGAEHAQIERNVIAGLQPGAIILMHENRGQTVRAMLGISAALQRKHLRAVSVPQLLTDDPPSLAQVRAGGAACGVRDSGRLGGG